MFEATGKMNSINSMIQGLKNKISFRFLDQCILGAPDPLSTTYTPEEKKEHLVRCVSKLAFTLRAIC